MERFDIVLNEVVNSTRSKTLARKLGDRVKFLLAHAMPEDYDEIDMPPNLLIESIGWILDDIKNIKPLEINFSILREMLKLQKDLYWQCDFEPNLVSQYRYFVKNYDTVYNEVCDGLNKIEKINFSFKLDYSKPLSQTLEDIDRYCTSLKVVAKSYHKIVVLFDEIGCKGVMPFLAFHHEVIGNEPTWEEKLTYWRACYNAYILHNIKGLKKAEVVRRLANSPDSKLYDFNLVHLENQEMSASTHKLDRFLDEAARLIASVDNGTFPY